MPSFTSVYEEGTKSQATEPLSDKDVSATSPCAPGDGSGQFRGHFPRASITSPFPGLHFHRGSTSTLASESTSSSPITVASLTESQSTWDTPAVSPDTPASSHSLSSLSPPLSLRSLHNTSPISQIPGPNELRRPSPPKRPRNLKGLAVDTSSAMALGQALNSGDVESQEPQEKALPAAPTAPSFTNPMKPPRRKASNLSLTIVTTPSSEDSSPHLEKQPGSPLKQLDEVPESSPMKAPAVPPTPSLQRPSLLRNHYSSPLFVVRSPGGGPEGGMRLPPLATQSSVPVGFSEPPIAREDETGTRQLHLPQSREEKPAAYADGPICIYDPHVYLFYEPSVEMASRYDVIFNVASEVKNPFKAAEQDRSNDNKDEPPETGFFTPNERVPSPSTPKAYDSMPTEAPENGRKEPEYIHKMWEHNTDIVPDLYELVKLIDLHVQQGKRILIHCQLGVSRSASLIVAYGLYKNPSITVQEAYDAVKRRSKWICPNMNLIMQLQEFRTGLLKSSAGLPSFGSQQVGAQVLYKRSKIKSISGLRPNDISAERSPQSAPLPPEVNKASPASIVIEGGEKVNPGPSSAPSGINWPSEKQKPNHTQQELNEPVQPHLNSQIRANSIPTPASHSYTPSTFSRRIDPEINEPPDDHHIKPTFNAPSYGAKQHRPLPLNMDSIIPPASKAAEARLERVEEHADDGLGVTSPRDLLHINIGDQRAQEQRQWSKTTSEVASPRSDEFAMTSVKNPEPDNTFGLTSPRPALPTTILNPQRPGEDYFGTVRTSYSAADDTLMSPRTEQFALHSIHPPMQDDGLGLTSPRPTTSSMQLPTKPSPPQREKSKQVTALHPLDESQVPESANARRELRSKLGMSTRSNYDMRHEYALSQKARRIAPPPLPPLAALTSTKGLDAGTEPLMSPRAAEIINNPFENHAGPTATAPNATEASDIARSENTTPKPAVVDPRSPPQPGSSAITRNIFDVL
ncbi:MAG: hypothetical protein M1828_006549 [Chrysothrix sp. TS-e1954]|nr:MAG: hypothetical protein M1828_006549 [Chrysothrix sp. TS-e1954]